MKYSAFVGAEIESAFFNGTDLICESESDLAKKGEKPQTNAAQIILFSRETNITPEILEIIERSISRTIRHFGHLLDVRAHKITDRDSNAEQCNTAITICCLRATDIEHDAFMDQMQQIANDLITEKLHFFQRAGWQISRWLGSINGTNNRIRHPKMPRMTVGYCQYEYDRDAKNLHQIAITNPNGNGRDSYDCNAVGLRMEIDGVLPQDSAQSLKLKISDKLDAALSALCEGYDLMVSPFEDRNSTQISIIIPVDKELGVIKKIYNDALYLVPSIAQIARNWEQPSPKPVAAAQRKPSPVFCHP